MDNQRVSSGIQAGSDRRGSFMAPGKALGRAWVGQWCLGLLLGFCAAVQPALADADRAEVETAFLSRNVYVPATVVIPLSAKDHPAPLVIMAHGHGGTRDEAGGFRSMATLLGKAGIASIRMDFPGCGDNPDPFTNNNLGNMLGDIAAARRFALDELPVDPERVAILGYSMGGRLAVLAAESEKYSAIALWSPVGLNGAKSMYDFMGGEKSWRHLRREADRDGTARFIAPWGAEQLLGKQWFDDLENSKPEDVIRNFTGPLLIIHGAADRHVTPGNSEALIREARQASSVESHFIEGADHGLGFYDGEAEVSGEVLRLTADFLARSLLNSETEEGSKP